MSNYYVKPSCCGDATGTESCAVDTGVDHSIAMRSGDCHSSMCGAGVAYLVDNLREHTFCCSAKVLRRRIGSQSKATDAAFDVILVVCRHFVAVRHTFAFGGFAKHGDAAKRRRYNDEYVNQKLHFELKHFYDSFCSQLCTICRIVLFLFLLFTTFANKLNKSRL